MSPGWVDRLLENVGTKPGPELLRGLLQGVDPRALVQVLRTLGILKAGGIATGSSYSD